MNQLCMNRGSGTPVRAVVLPIAALLVAGLISVAGATPEMAGTWRALMNTPQGDVEIVMTLELTEGAWSGQISDPTGSGRDLTMEALSFRENSISFNFRPEGTPFPASFFGNYLFDSDVLRGTFSIAGRSSPLTRFERTSPLPASLQPAEGEEEKRGRVRHQFNFGIGARFGVFVPIHILEDDKQNINDITTGGQAYDLNVRWYMLDGLALVGRYFKGGLNFNTNDYNLSLFEDYGLTKDSYLKLDGWEIAINGYVGNSIMPNSKFNPYIVLAAGKSDWALSTEQRGSEPVLIDDKPVQDQSWQFGAGLGTEYEISRRVFIEAEWLWRFVLTEDADKWPNPEDLWSNTHYWALSLGFVMLF